MSNELPGAVAVLKRYFLSDAANQANILLATQVEHSDCALSIIEQPPLDPDIDICFADIDIRMAAAHLLAQAYRSTGRKICIFQNTRFRPVVPGFRKNAGAVQP